MSLNSKGGMVVSFILAVALGFIIGFFVASPSIHDNLATQEQLNALQTDLKEVEQKVNELSLISEIIKELEMDIKAELSEVEKLVMEYEDEVPESFKEIFPNSQFRRLEENIYQVYKDGQIVGYIGIGSKKGFIDTIKATVGLNTDGTLKGVRIIEQNETTGMGDKITEREFLSQFEGLHYNNINVDTITGATVSSSTVESIVKEVAQKLSEYI